MTGEVKLHCPSCVLHAGQRNKTQASGALGEDGDEVPDTRPTQRLDLLREDRVHSFRFYNPFEPLDQRSLNTREALMDKMLRVVRGGVRVHVGTLQVRSVICGDVLPRIA